ncbi:MAG: hypothetical protein IT379_40140 [Deltaproteobacteria bacterium]|nr:hypothetical protein [Deltaproteobacteria bacterium]
MAWIEGTERRTYDIHAPIEKVYAFLSTPELLKAAFLELERHEILDATTARWILKEKNEKGVKFRPDYTVRYGGNGTDRVEWSPVAGNMKARGTARLRPKGPDTTEVQYEETIASDIPINSLIAKVFQGIVAREIKKGVQGFLDRVKARLEGS